jgi:branched-chain amino acid transport system permease protein
MVRNWVKYGAAGVLFVLLAFLPLLTGSRATLNLFTQVYIFSIFALSYNLLLGYTGIVSFGHALFFGSGAYLVGLLLKHAGTGPAVAAGGILSAAVFALLVSLVIGAVSLRVREVYFAMLTLAFGELFYIAALKWRGITGGEDGFSFSVPAGLSDRVVFYYLALFVFALVLLFLRIFVSSPTGAVLQAIRENEHRAEALGYDVFRYKLFSTVVAGILAALAGGLYGLQQRFVSAAVLSLEKTMDALLMTIIGGSGTLLGPVAGAALVTFAHEWFTRLARVNPIFERWLILFGLVYVFIVLFMPGGLVRAVRGLAGAGRKRPDRA